MNFIELLIESSDDIKKQLGTEIKKWSKFKHVKADLEFMLANAIIELSFVTKDGKQESIVCTSNIPLIKAINASTDKGADKCLSLPFIGLKTKSTKSVDVWDLVENKRKTILLKDWNIVIPHIVTLTTENIKKLHELINKLLKA